MYEHDNLIYHAATGRSWKSHKYIKKIGNKYIYKDDLENVKKKLKQGGKKVSDWNKSGKTSKYDKNISDIKKNHKKEAKAREDSAKQELINKATKGSQYAEKVNQISSSRAKNKKVVTNQVPGNNNIQDRYNNATYSKKKKKKNNNVVLPAGYNTNYRDAANKAYE